MNDALERALEKNPQERFSCCKEFVDALKGKKPEPAVNHPVEKTTEVVAPAPTVASAPATARTPARAVPAVVPARYEAKGRSCGCIVSALIAALVAVAAVVAQLGLNTWSTVKEWMDRQFEEKPSETSRGIVGQWSEAPITGRGASERRRVQCQKCGGQKIISRYKACQSCNGNGSVPNPVVQVGQVVNAVGDIFNAVDKGWGGLPMPRMPQGPSELTCQSCGGSGCVNETQLCTKCRGDGSVWE